MTTQAPGLRPRLRPEMPGTPLGRMTSRWRGWSERRRTLVLGLGALAVASVLPLVLPSNNIDTAATAMIYVLLAMGLNVVVGYAGLLDLGYAAFFAIGAYGYALVGSNQLAPFVNGAINILTQNPQPQGVHVNFWLALPFCAALAALFGAVLGAPTLRLRGDYLAIVTLGFGEIVPIVVRNVSPITGGINGIVGVDQPQLGPLKFALQPVPYFYATLAVLIVLVVLNANLRDSRLGRAWMAIREDEIAAACMGINTVATKLLAFAMGAAFAGFAGAIYAAKTFFVSPDDFVFVVSVTVLVMVVLGGMGNIVGVMLGAAIISFIQFYVLIQVPPWVHQNLPWVTVDLAQLNYVIFGSLLVLVMLLRPQGLLPSAVRRAELKVALEHEGADPISPTGEPREEVAP